MKTNKRAVTPVSGPLKSVAIYLHGRDLDPAQVTRALSIAPTGAQTRGGPTSSSAKFVAKVGMWKVKIRSESSSLSHLVDELLQKFDSVAGLDGLEGVETAYLDFLFAFGEERDYETLELKLSKTQLAKIVRLGLAISVTVM